MNKSVFTPWSDIRFIVFHINEAANKPTNANPAPCPDPNQSEPFVAAPFPLYNQEPVF